MKKIRKIAREKGMTMTGLARTVGIDRGHLYAIDNGAANPTVETLKKIAKALDVDVKELGVI